MLVLLISSSAMLKQSALAQKNATTATTIAPSPITTKTTNNFLTYENPTIGINIQYPADWIKNATSQGVTFILAAKNNSNPDQFWAKLDAFNVPGFPLNMPLKAMADGVLNGYKRSLPNFQLESYTNTTLGGNPAVKIVYMFTNSKEGNLKATDIGTIKNNRLYVIQYYVESAKYQNYLPILQKIVDSFTIKK
jgi:PsbP-like protein